MSETQYGSGTFDGNPDSGEGTTTPVSETAEQGTPEADQTDIGGAHAADVDEAKADDSTDEEQAPETAVDEVTAGEESAEVDTRDADEPKKPVWDVSTHGPAPSGSEGKYEIING